MSSAAPNSRRCDLLVPNGAYLLPEAAQRTQGEMDFAPGTVGADCLQYFFGDSTPNSMLDGNLSIEEDERNIFASFGELALQGQATSEEAQWSARQIEEYNTPLAEVGLSGFQMEISPSVLPLFFPWRYNRETGLPVSPRLVDGNMVPLPNMNKLISMQATLLGLRSQDGCPNLNFVGYTLLFYKHCPDEQKANGSVFEFDIYLQDGKRSGENIPICYNGTDMDELRAFYKQHKEGLVQNLTNRRGVVNFCESFDLHTLDDTDNTEGPLVAEGMIVTEPFTYVSLVRDLHKSTDWRACAMNGKHRGVASSAVCALSPLDLTHQSSHLIGQLTLAHLATAVDTTATDVLQAYERVSLDPASQLNRRVTAEALVFTRDPGRSFSEVLRYARGISCRIGRDQTETTKEMAVEELRRLVVDLGSLMGDYSRNWFSGRINAYDDWQSTHPPSQPKMFEEDLYVRLLNDPTLSNLEGYCATRIVGGCPPFLPSVANMIKDDTVSHNHGMDPSTMNAVVLMPIICRIVFKYWFGKPWGAPYIDLTKFLIECHCSTSSSYAKVGHRDEPRIEYYNVPHWGNLHHPDNLYLAAALFVMDCFNCGLAFGVLDTLVVGTLEVLEINGDGENSKDVIATCGRIFLQFDSLAGRIAAYLRKQSGRVREPAKFLLKWIVRLNLVKEFLICVKSRGLSPTVRPGLFINPAEGCCELLQVIRAVSEDREAMTPGEVEEAKQLYLDAQCIVCNTGDRNQGGLYNVGSTFAPRTEQSMVLHVFVLWFSAYIKATLLDKKGNAIIERPLARTDDTTRGTGGRGINFGDNHDFTGFDQFRLVSSHHLVNLNAIAHLVFTPKHEDKGLMEELDALVASFGGQIDLKLPRERKKRAARGDFPLPKRIKCSFSTDDGRETADQNYESEASGPGCGETSSERGSDSPWLPSNDDNSASTDGWGRLVKRLSDDDSMRVLGSNDEGGRLSFDDDSVGTGGGGVAVEDDDANSMLASESDDEGEKDSLLKLGPHPLEPLTDEEIADNSMLGGGSEYPTPLEGETGHRTLEEGGGNASEGLSTSTTQEGPGQRMTSLLGKNYAEDVDGEPIEPGMPRASEDDESGVMAGATESPTQEKEVDSSKLILCCTEEDALTDGFEDIVQEQEMRIILQSLTKVVEEMNVDSLAESKHAIMSHIDALYATGRKGAQRW